MDLLGGMLLGGSLFGGSPFAASSSDMAAIASSLGILGSFISMIWCCGGRGFFYPSKEDSAGANEGVERGLADQQVLRRVLDDEEPDVVLHCLLQPVLLEGHPQRSQLVYFDFVCLVILLCDCLLRLASRFSGLLVWFCSASTVQRPCASGLL